MARIEIDGLPELSWSGAEGAGCSDGQTLTLVAEPGVDWINDPWSGDLKGDATALVFAAPTPEFTLSARVQVAGPRTTFDAGVLCAWAGKDCWAKLCFEYSPAGDPMVVSVVTNGWSDDCNSTVVDGDSVHLRISRGRQGWAFHSSDDGQRWTFVRAFRLSSDLPVRVGFLAQSPNGGHREIRFDQIGLSDTSPADLRDGS